MRYAIIDSLRGVAALWVFAFHIFFNESFFTFPQAIINLCANGDLGVQMFFVISGFCLMASLQNAFNNNQTASSFLFHRFKRIYVTFWFSIILVALLPFLIEFISSFKSGYYISPFTIKTNSYEYLYYSFGDWFRVVSLLQIFNPIEYANTLDSKFNSINGVYWTLGIEMQFYLIMTLGFYFKKKIYIFLGFITAISLLITLFYPHLYQTGMFFFHWHYFALGILVYYFFSLGLRPSNYLSFRWVTYTILTLLLFILSYSLTQIQHMDKIIFAIIFTLMLWLIEILDVLYQKLLSNKNIILLVFNLLGVISYSIYLVHAKIILIVSMFVRQVLDPSSLIFTPICFFLTILCCYIFYLLCEKPFIRTKIKNIKLNSST